MKRMTLLALFAAVLATPAVRAELPPIIPRDTLFGNPQNTGPQISPDGKSIAYLRPDEKNVLQVWVYATENKPQSAVAITQDAKRGIREFFWAYDNKHLLYLQDKGGDENFHLFAVDVAAKTTRELTPFDGVRVQGVETDKKHPNEVLVGLNKRDKASFDMHRIKLDTGEEKLDTENPGGAIGFETDAKFQVRGCTMAKPDGGFELKVKGDDGKWKMIKTVGSEDQAQLAGFGAEPNIVYLIHSANANAMRFIQMDTNTGKEMVIAEDQQYDVSSVAIDDDKRTPLAVSFTKARNEWTVLDNSVKDDFAALRKIVRGDFTIGSKSADDTKWLVTDVTDDGPVHFYLYDRKTKKADFLFNNNSKLENLKLAKMEPFDYKAKDGLTVHGYLTKPVGVDAKNLPAVLLVHGGPWARDSWGYSGLVQWLANRGYAVIQVNFRGSTGYGKSFLNASNKEWSGKMHQDLLDAVDHFAGQGVIDAKKTAIMGGSYGGYATLVGLAFTPEKFTCGVDIVGPSNLNTLLSTIPPYWAPMKAMFNNRVGEDKDFLEKCSPLYRADQITKPLLIGQGANDPRVKQAESDQIVSAMRKNKKEVQYVLYPDEGHGFQRPENRLHFFAVSEEFLAKHLGGRCEPVGEIKGHTGQLK
jgi:dipeptidyl aminopeptidase/acylaminoacyl peptidase